MSFAMYKESFSIVCFYTVCLPLVLLLTSVLAACHNDSAPAERYGFVARLGNDTVSLESVTRQGNRLVSDEVDRFPAVRVRHTEIELDSNGSIRRLVMDIHTPGETEKARDCQVIADVTKDSVLLSKKDGTGTLHRKFARNGSLIVAHVPQMYSLYELYFAAAEKQPDFSMGSAVPMRQFYIDREFDRFPLGNVVVRPSGGGKAEIQHDWLSGTGEATLDSAYHMLRYSGARTTYKVNVERLSSPPDTKNIADRFAALETKGGAVRQLSVRDTARAQIGNATFTITYSRPLMRGRKLLGDVIPLDHVWRTGANAATQFTTPVNIHLAGMLVPAGTYTLWTLPHADGGVDLIVNKETGQWGTEYDYSRNLGITRMVAKAGGTPVEAFSISILAKDAQHGTLVMEWGTFRWTAAIDVK
ncbi:MAG: DUF2911 domain-containing protein [Williamsia sp.]|nr:DUF2911 domain-containing protein [Williamsia sp.]